MTSSAAAEANTLYNPQILSNMKDRFEKLYGAEQADALMNSTLDLMSKHQPAIDTYNAKYDKSWSEKDALLITYGDMVQEEGKTPLKAQHEFMKDYMGQTLPGIHLLPFYPYSSDGGFSVIDYREVGEHCGDWSDVEAMAEDYKMAFDLVLNHCSAESPWFKNFLAGTGHGHDFFQTESPETDLSQVTRPRATPLLTPFETASGTQHVWTTFSADQVDLDWQNTDVLLEFIDIYLFYLAKGCRVVRMDAVGFMWKIIGTTCMHLPEVHELVKLFRDITDAVAEGAIVLTETNVPHKENISYFGDGDEAQMVYQFPLPPLLLFCLLKGDTTYIHQWASNLEPLAEGCTFFNYTSSHDGVGVRQLSDFTTDEELYWLADQVKARGGEVNYRSMPDGSERPYELTGTYYSHMSEPGEAADAKETGMKRFLCAEAVRFAMQGIPGVYFHCLVGCESWQEGYQATDHKRDLNRRKWQRSELDAMLADSDSHHAQVFAAMKSMIDTRSQQPAFHPDASQRILDLGPSAFGIVRDASNIAQNGEESQKIVCLYNFTNAPITLDVSGEMRGQSSNEASDLLSGAQMAAEGVQLQPYQAVWIVA